MTSTSAETRRETDSIGAVDVPASAYWGAQTQRSLQNFRIGGERLPAPLIRALGIVKQAASRVNVEAGLLDAQLGAAIDEAAGEVIAGALDDHFPLVVWQTGSGTQSNMNANEVIANRACEILGRPMGAKTPVHPNDHVNRSQSSNDTFPTAMHIAAVEQCHRLLLPRSRTCSGRSRRRRRPSAGSSRSGGPIFRTRRRSPSARSSPATRRRSITGSHACAPRCPGSARSPRGAPPSAPGSTPGPVSMRASRPRSRPSPGCRSGPPRTSSRRSPPTTRSWRCRGALNTVAASLMKIANDIRLLGSGPRCGFGELELPANEPGSSIMPGKVNPTQAEALTMVAAQVMGNHVAITVSGASGHFELNVFKPVMIYNLLQSIRLIGDGARSFTDHCVAGIEANRERIDRLLHESLMLVTALNPHIGYDNAARVAKKAHAEGLTLKQAALGLGVVSEADFERWVDPAKMTRPTPVRAPE